MKKFFIAVVISLLEICFSEDFKGFLGIEWGTERNVCIDAMMKKGWQCNNDGKYLICTGGTYGGKQTKMVSFDFDDRGLLREIFVFFYDENDADLIIDALIKKYDLLFAIGLSVKTFLTQDRKTAFYRMKEYIMVVTDYEYIIKQIEQRNKVDESDL